jgi:hypothetical protein
MTVALVSSTSAGPAAAALLPMVTVAFVSSTAAGPLIGGAGGVGAAGAAAAATGVPQLVQNFEPASRSAPQDAHLATSRAPHPPQKAAPSRFSFPHDGHFTVMAPHPTQALTCGSGRGEPRPYITAPWVFVE